MSSSEAPSDASPMFCGTCTFFFVLFPEHDIKSCRITHNALRATSLTWENWANVLSASMGTWPSNSWTQSLGGGRVSDKFKIFLSNWIIKASHWLASKIALKRKSMWKFYRFIFDPGWNLRPALEQNITTIFTPPVLFCKPLIIFFSSLFKHVFILIPPCVCATKFWELGNDSKTN